MEEKWLHEIKPPLRYLYTNPSHVQLENKVIALP